MPPIIVDRSSGAIKSAPALPQTQKDLLWAEIVRNYARKHPEIFEAEDASQSQ